MNSLAAALVKTRGGDLTREEDWDPALHAARHTVEAIADFVLAQQRTQAASRHEVVGPLRAEQSAAPLDRLEFDSALTELQRILQYLVASLRELHTAAQPILVANNQATFADLGGVHEHAGRLREYAREILDVLREIRRAAQGWNGADSHAQSSPPSSARS